MGKQVVHVLGITLGLLLGVICLTVLFWYLESCGIPVIDMGY